VKSKNTAVAQRPQKVASTRETFRLSLPTVDGQQLLYARASGDNNFIHTSAFLARLAGLPRTVLHGNCALAMISNALIKKLVDNDINRVASVAGRFGKPVIPGETLTIVGHESGTERSIPFTVFNSQGKPVFREGIFTMKS
jgi:acyl dehydratase